VQKGKETADHVKSQEQGGYSTGGGKDGGRFALRERAQLAGQRGKGWERKGWRLAEKPSRKPPNQLLWQEDGPLPGLRRFMENGGGRLSDKWGGREAFTSPSGKEHERRRGGDRLPYLERRFPFGGKRGKATQGEGRESNDFSEGDSGGREKNVKFHLNCARKKRKKARKKIFKET